MIVAGTGHRPDDIQSYGHAYNVAEIKLQSKPVEVFICGMAAGFDLIAAEAAMKLGIKVWAARPWAEHTVPLDWKLRYDEVLAASDKVYVIAADAAKPNSHGQAAQWLHARNHWMVDHADAVMAYWNPEKQSGGTYECIQYALKKKVPVANTWNDPPF